MNPDKKSEQITKVYDRLIALWVICEAFAGGILHGLKFPFSGLIVSSLAIFCIILIGFYAPSRSSIIRATVIVAIFKLMLSPHSPPTAYIAVFFQGILGQLLLSNRKFFRIGCIALALLSLVESAVQRILVLVIIYGNGIWNAFDLFIQKLTGDPSPTPYSYILAGMYVLVHAMVGILLGIVAWRLAIQSQHWKIDHPNLLIELKPSGSETGELTGKKRRRLSGILLVTWVVLLLLYLHSFLFPSYQLFPKNILMNMMIRSGLIILSWILIISPLLMMLINRILQSQKQKYLEEINVIGRLLPEIKNIFIESLKRSKTLSGFKRIKLFLKMLLMNILAY